MPSKAISENKPAALKGARRCRLDRRGCGPPKNAPAFSKPTGGRRVAEAAKWAHAHAEILADSHWVGGDPAELADPAWAGRLHDLSPRLSDFAATAAAISQLDLVISVDTAAAHVAGALGVPVWVPLPLINTDWRWGTKGDTTDWYPGMRLFRQTAPNGWTGPVQAIMTLLRA